MSPSGAAGSEVKLQASFAIVLSIVLFGVLLTSGAIADDRFPATPAKLKVVEKLAMAEAICGVQPHVDGERVSCDRCPGNLVNTGGWSLGAVYGGHFTSSTAQNALVEMMGCGSNPHNVESAALLTRQGGHWKMTDSWDEAMAQACHKVKAPAGYEVLVCEKGTGWMGVSEESIWLLDFHTTGRVDQQSLASTSDNTGMGCMVAEVSRETIDEVVFGELQPDGASEIIITITDGHLRMTGQQQEKCRADAVSRHEVETPLEPELRTRKVRYRYDGELHSLSGAKP